MHATCGQRFVTRRGIWTLVAVFVLVSTLALPGEAVPKEQLRPQVLGRINVISGPATGYIPVRLEERAVLDYNAFAPSGGGFDRLFREGGPTPSIDIKGGSFAGFMLTDGSVRQSGPVVMAGTFRSCKTRCKPGEIMNFSYPISTGKTISLKPGDYRLFLITSGDRARVTFRFDSGPTGRVALGTHIPTHADASNWLAPDNLERTGHNATTAHETLTDAFGLSLMVVDGPYTAEGMGVCINEGSTPIASEVCGEQRSNTLSRINAGPVGGRAPTFVMFYVNLGMTPGDWWLGGWYVNPTPPDLLAVLTLTADYDRARLRE